MSERVIFSSLFSVDRRKIKRSVIVDRVISYSVISCLGCHKIVFFYLDVKKGPPEGNVIKSKTVFGILTNKNKQSTFTV